MYLTRGIVDQDDKLHSMCGIFPVKARMEKKLASLGYRQVRLRRPGFFGPKDTVLRGHEFHYSTVDEMGGDIERLYMLEKGGAEGYCHKNTLGSYINLHFGFNPATVTALVDFVKGKK